PRSRMCTASSGKSARSRSRVRTLMPSASAASAVVVARRWASRTSSRAARCSTVGRSSTLKARRMRSGVVCSAMRPRCIPTPRRFASRAAQRKLAPLRLDRARAEATRVIALRDSEREVTGTSHGSAHHHPLRPRRQPPSGLVALDVDPAHLLAPLAVPLALKVPAHSHLDGDALVDLGLSAVRMAARTRHCALGEGDPPDAPRSPGTGLPVAPTGQRGTLIFGADRGAVCVEEHREHHGPPRRLACPFGVLLEVVDEPARILPHDAGLELTAAPLRPPASDARAVRVVEADQVVGAVELVAAERA